MSCCIRTVYSQWPVRINCIRSICSIIIVVSCCCGICMSMRIYTCAWIRARIYIPFTAEFTIRIMPWPFKMQMITWSSSCLSYISNNISGINTTSYAVWWTTLHMTVIRVCAIIMSDNQIIATIVSIFVGSYCSACYRIYRCPCTCWNIHNNISVYILAFQWSICI